MIPLIEGLAAWKLARGSQSRPSSVPEHRTCLGIPPAGVNGRSVSSTVHSQIPGVRHRGCMMPGDLARPLSLSLSHLASDASPQCMDGSFDGPVSLGIHAQLLYSSPPRTRCPALHRLAAVIDLSSSDLSAALDPLDVFM